MKARRRAAVAAALTALVVATGCGGLPESGPVVEVDVPEEADAERASDIDARPPEPGASRLAIVNGFLDAMTAWPIRTSVAKKYLTEDAAGEWNPEAGTIVYDDFLPPSEEGGGVDVDLTGANRLDGTGGWRGALPDAESSLRFHLTVEDGEFRIIDPVDALVVPASWFQQRFRQVSLYYFDPAAEILVPEPVFVPIGEQLATSLVSALAAGPPDGLSGVVRTFVPPGLSVGLSVPVSDTGVADITLVGDAPRVSEAEAELLAAQLAWTLRQDSSIAAFRVTIGDQELDLPGGVGEYDVEGAGVFDPAGSGATSLLFGISQGRLVLAGYGTLDPVDGPLGRRRLDLRSVAAAPDASRVAAVVEGGTSVVVAPVRSPGASGVETVLDDATDLARPAWDYAGRLWLLDHTADGARILVAHDGRRAREVDVPEVTGRDVGLIRVSRDGTRLVALVRGEDDDRLVTSRVVIGEDGDVDGVIDPITIWASGGGARATDVAWTGPAEIAVLTPARPEALFEVESVSADGASVDVDTLSTIVSGEVRGLAGAPSADVPVYAVLPDGLVDVRSAERIQFDKTVRSLDYAG